MAKQSGFVNSLDKPGQSLEYRDTIPEDLHWKDLPKDKFFGEIYCNSLNKYYSRACGRRYRPKTNEHHLDEGHFQGYSFGVEHFSKPGDVVLDPFVGSGTAMIESYLQGRNSVGVEVEYSALLEANIKHIESIYPQEGISNEVIIGDARTALKGFKTPTDLVITGFPYPIIGAGFTADKPMRFDKHSAQDYTHENSLGLLKWNGDFLPEMIVALNEATEQLKVGGHFITLIKDAIHKKQPFFLQKFVVDEFLRVNPNFILDSWYIHRHTPQTMFMNTYPKRFPDVSVPYYQIGVVLKKIS